LFETHCMKRETINGGIVDLDTGELLSHVDIKPGEIRGDLRLHHDFLLPTTAPKWDPKVLIKANLKPSTLRFLIILIEKMERDGRVKDGQRLSGKHSNYEIIAKYYNMKKSTLADHMKELRDKEIIRKHRNKAFFINPLYAYKFSRIKIPTIVADVFPEHFRNRVTSNISDK
jgi:hypothetical protein